MFLNFSPAVTTGVWVPTVCASTVHRLVTIKAKKGMVNRIAVSFRYFFIVSQLIQLVRDSGFHLVVVFLSFVQNSIELLPVMSLDPKRDSFQPPNENGSRGTGTPMLTPIIPALACSIT